MLRKFDTLLKERNENDRNKFYDKKTTATTTTTTTSQGSIQKHYATRSLKILRELELPKN